MLKFHAISLVLFVSFFSNFSASATPNFSLVTFGLEQSSGGDFFAVRISLDSWSIEVLRSPSPTDARSAAIKSNAVVAINANFFSPEKEALGLVVSKGITYQRLHSGGQVLTGVFALTGSGPRIVQRSSYLELSMIAEAVQAGPRLIENGAALKLVHAEVGSRRSAIAIDGKGRVLIFVSKSRFPGMSLGELQQHLLQLGAKDALNLDGGGSSQLYFKGTNAIPENFITGGDNVPVFLLIKPKVFLSTLY